MDIEPFQSFEPFQSLWNWFAHNDDYHCGSEPKHIIVTTTDYEACKMCGKGCLSKDHLPYCSELCKQIDAREG